MFFQPSQKIHIINRIGRACSPLQAVRLQLCGGQGTGRPTLSILLIRSDAIPLFNINSVAYGVEQCMFA